MSRIFLFAILFLFTVDSFSASANLIKEPKADQILIELPGIDISLSLTKFVRLKPEEFKKITGHKLTLKEMIIFKITQKRIKKTIRKDGTVDMLAFTRQAKEPFKWNWGGFFLGILFPIGFIIALCIKDEKRKDRIRSSLFGIATAFLLAIIIGLMLNPINI